jgi:hypothetical protein
MVTTHLHLAPRLRMSEAIPVLTHPHSWHGQGQLYAFNGDRLSVRLNRLSSFHTIPYSSSSQGWFQEAWVSRKSMQWKPCFAYGRIWILVPIFYVFHRIKFGTRMSTNTYCRMSFFLICAAKTTLYLGGQLNFCLHFLHLMSNLSEMR